jgi:hypothetical protein
MTMKIKECSVSSCVRTLEVDWQYETVSLCEVHLLRSLGFAFHVLALFEGCSFKHYAPSSQETLILTDLNRCSKKSHTDDDPL